MKWRYFGRHSGVNTYEIYRCPDNGKSLFDTGQQIERVQKNGGWEADEKGALGLSNEKSQGWFDENDDEIPEAEALALIVCWQREGWPGRS